MLLFCCASNQATYSVIFPSLGSLQQYIEFDVRTITMLEKLLGLGFFGTIVDHLIHCHVILLVSSRELGLLSMVQHATLALLKCWVLITFALVFRFQ
jgi:hypothetical protein